MWLQGIPYYDPLEDLVFDPYLTCGVIGLVTFDLTHGQIISTQNNVLAKVTLRFIALDLMIDFNSINSSETLFTVKVYLKA
jgi:hypothetical protein